MHTIRTLDVKIRQLKNNLLSRLLGPHFLTEAAIAVCFLCIPLLSLLHQSVVLLIALSLQVAGSHELFGNLAVGIGLDPVYASVLNTTLGNIEVMGLAVAAPLGDGLHQLLPSLFAEPGQLMPGAWVTTVVKEGASLLPVTIASFGSEAIFIALGLLLLVVSLRKDRARKANLYLVLTILGIILQARGIMGLISLRFTSQDLEVMGLAHFFTKLLPMDASAYRDLVGDPALMLFTYLVPLALLIVLYSPVIIVGLLRYKPWRRRWSFPWQQLIRAVQAYRRLWAERVNHPSQVVVTLLIVGVLFQMAFPDMGNYSYKTEADAEAVDEAAGVGAAHPNSKGVMPTPTSAPAATPTLSLGPSKVTIEGSGYNFTYKVNGEPVRIQGVGYNVPQAEMPFEERVARYDKDFAQMKAQGINTILGWDQRQFDGLSLKMAQKYGLGVVMPYFLASHWDYSNRSVAEKIENDVKAWVILYRNAPSLRMWGIGNEVIHGMGSNPEKKRMKIFAHFYVKLADTIHALDPDHPVVYRDAEDVYAGAITDEVAKDGVARPWFVYGVNFFTPRLADALRDWPKKGADIPLMVSEFAPNGLSAADRPKAYLQMWHSIVTNKAYVLGGFAYVWDINGPEAIDRVMGLVDDDAVPVDGALQLLGKAFRHELKSLDNSASPTTPPK